MLCNNLRSINIPSGVTYFGESSFYQCFNLERVSIPNSVHTIKGNCFSECYDLKEIIIHAITAPTLSGCQEDLLKEKNIKIPNIYKFDGTNIKITKDDSSQ